MWVNLFNAVPRLRRGQRCDLCSGGAGRKMGVGENEFPPRPRFHSALSFVACGGVEKTKVKK